MSAPEGNSQFCFPEILKNIAEMQGETQLRGGPLEIPGGGGGWKFPKKIRARKNAWKKIRAAITSEKKKIVQANSKVQIVLKKKLCRG